MLATWDVNFLNTYKSVSIHNLEISSVIIKVLKSVGNFLMLLIKKFIGFIVF